MSTVRPFDALAFDPRHDEWTAYELIEGERLVGRVERLPEPGGFHGRSLFVQTDAGRVLSIPATAKAGHSVLARQLEALSVGDRIAIEYRGKRATLDGGRVYRQYVVVSVDG
jgi:hypothetical protein